jgi:hypothetical protein
MRSVAIPGEVCFYGTHLAGRFRAGIVASRRDVDLRR